MSSEMNFDANTVKPNSRPEPVPNGDYRAMIVASDVLPVSSGKGRMLKLEFQILDGEHKGRKVWEQLNIQHESEEAQKIAQGQLSAICHATGVMQLKNSVQLHNIPLIIRTRIKQSAGYDPKNEIKGYLPVPGGTPAPAAAQAPATAVPAATTAAAPAWARKTA